MPNGRTFKVNGFADPSLVSLEGGFCNRDKEEGGRQLPNTASPNADAVGEGMEYSETDADNDGLPEGSDSVMEGRVPVPSISVSIGVLNDILSLEHLDSLSVRERVAVVNDGMPSSLLCSREIPHSGSGGGESETIARAAAPSSTPDILGVEVALRKEW